MKTIYDFKKACFKQSFNFQNMRFLYNIGITLGDFSSFKDDPQYFKANYLFSC